MSLTAHDICMDTALYRAAYPQRAATETLAPADDAPLFAAGRSEPDCPDCGAPPGRSCYPDCLRYAEGV